MHFDLLISGAGPAGLCLAQAMSGQGLSIGIVEQQPQAAIAGPAFDGREIALTQPSAATLRRLGLWDRIQAFDAAALSPLRDARVMNGPSPFALVIGHGLAARSELGWLVSNHLIRRAAWEAMQDSMVRHCDITLLAGEAVTQVAVNADAAQVTLAGGATHRARLLVAADSRFSTTRRAVGIGAAMHDFGRSMLVCQVTHELPHEHVAWEWFGHGQTLALLPMNGDPATGAHRASVVLTLPHQQIEPLLTLDEDDFSAQITRRFDTRLGAMRLTSTRHAYPLVGVYPHRLVAPRFACVGDAAVGMHPVTAHGFNFGLLSVEALSRELLQSHAAARDIGAPEPLARYQRTHRLATRPLYEATRLVATLYTAEARPARLLRDTALRVAERLTPFKHAIAAQLAGGR
ncbi:5-demethoxyubiquinol-8 5-hydroxylase UbiM [Ottowia testudinis]|uniref:5-demethoxyubiquinol-8 5-hydroxylase UbiM n=1 Tax=Ottowia testudinis TaxID=2816950 RepID=A0A975H3X2_9BURK|nr:5-demethoxyubiquinol-8 5-hydroxylase UbiM [Ottowia testudinis]QTD46323.1 5-demethoxyubiquinol-8 5-hydroxylase UbiM [Ottowia testudinis]